MNEILIENEPGKEEEGMVPLMEVSNDCRYLGPEFKLSSGDHFQWYNNIINQIPIHNNVLGPLLILKWPLNFLLNFGSCGGAVVST